MFKTIPIVILTAGHTVDGREVPADTLRQMAANYDPNVYNARINIEHSRYGAKLGSVLSLSVKEEDGKVKLYAELKPNDYMLYMIASGQKLHTSCEIAQNFAQTGEPYLVGLAMTDTPASLGTTEMHLSVEESGGAEQLSVQCYSTDQEPLHIATENPTLFHKLFKQEDTSMNKAILELTQQLSEQQSKTLEALTSLEEKVIALQAAPAPQANDAPQTDDQPDESDKAGDQVDLSVLADALNELKTVATETQTLLTNALNEDDDVERHQARGGDEDQPDDLVL